MRKITKRSAIITGVTVVAMGAGAAAWAANGWTITGSGTAQADAATITPLTGIATIAGKVWPGKATTISMQVNNSNEFPVNLTTTSFVPGQITVTPAGDDATACKTELTSSALEAVGNPSGSSTIPAFGNTTVTAALTVGDLPLKCAGKSFSLAYTFTGVSAA